MMEIWELLKTYVKEFEIANQCKFSDDAWARIKQLERDILAAMQKQERNHDPRHRASSGNE